MGIREASKVKRRKQMRLDNVWLKEENSVEPKLQADDFDLNHSSIGAASSDWFFSAAKRQLLAAISSGRNPTATSEYLQSVVVSC
jgi:hypothetical protein